TPNPALTPAPARRPPATAPDKITGAVLTAAQERAALLHALRHARLLRVEAVRRPLRILHDALFGKLFEVIGPIPIRTPLPDIAAHVVEAEAVRRERADGRCPLIPVLFAVLPRKASLPDVRGPLAARLQLVAPRIAVAIQAAARREFKLGFGRQSLARPFRVGHRVVPRDLDCGMTFAPLQIAPRPFGAFPIRAGHVLPPVQKIVERDFGEGRRENC